MANHLPSAPVDTRNPFGVEVDEIWVSCDHRDDSRQLKVLEVNLETGRAKVCSPWGPAPNRHIALKRFRPNSTGYRRLHEPKRTVKVKPVNLDRRRLSAVAEAA